MKNAHKFCIMLALGAGGILAGALSGCVGMWLGTDTDWNFTQPGGFGVDIGVATPPIHIGGPVGGPGFLGPGGPPPPPPPYLR